MDLIAAFLLFAGTMAGSLALGHSMLWAMGVGFAGFLWAGLRRGFPLSGLLRMSAAGARESLIVVRVMLTIGVLTGLWRSAGTFAVLTAWGLRLIAPNLFILAAFLLSSMMSYAIGTSFGTAGTMGITLMALARGGGADEVLTAGAILSGLYVGDRGSPASSCANLVSALTGTELYANVKRMMRTALIPFLLSILFYGLLSLRNPLAALTPPDVRGFVLSPWAALPAALMLGLPLAGVRVFPTFLASIAAAFACTVLVQGMGVMEALSCALWGYHAPGSLFNGGGLLSMVELCCVLAVSGTYSGILDGTGMLEDVEARLERAAGRVGRLPVTAAVGAAADGIFCNQTVGVMVTNQVVRRLYADHGELALDMANSTVMVAGMIPWCLGCSVPLAMMAVSPRAVPWAVYLYLLPLCYGLMKRFFPGNPRGNAIIKTEPKMGQEN